MFRDLIEDLDDLHNYTPEPHMILDVPYVPSDEDIVQAMLDLAKVGPQDVLYDLGSGDGRILIAAAKMYNARGVGVDIDPERIADAMEYAGEAGAEYQVDFLEEDLFTVDISEATVVTLYLLDSVNIQLRPRLLNELRPGTRIISQTFDMGDWQADEWRRLNGVRLYKWIVPAQIAGTWEWEGLDGTLYQVELEQQYQEVTGKAWMAGQAAHLDKASLCGNCLELTIRAADSDLRNYFTLDVENDALQSVQEGE